jgi:hypothetical protein
MERDELLQRYHEARLLLEDLVAAWPLFLRGHRLLLSCGGAP